MCLGLAGEGRGQQQGIVWSPSYSRTTNAINAPAPPKAGPRSTRYPDPETRSASAGVPKEPKARPPRSVEEAIRSAPARWVVLVLVWPRVLRPKESQTILNSSSVYFEVSGSKVNEFQVRVYCCRFSFTAQSEGSHSRLSLVGASGRTCYK